MSSSQQRRWEAACPHCGAPVAFASAASASAVCSYCRSTLVREGEALRKIGLSAELFEDYSPVQLGASGRHAGASFSVLGRLQLRYAEGSWNEWHILFDGGRSAWLSEDNGAFVIAFEAPLDAPAPALDELIVGAQHIINGQPWQVASKLETTLLAAEGELPHPPELLKSFWVVELRNELGEVGSLEYSQPGRPSWSLGRSVRLAELAMSGLRQDSSKSVAAQARSCPSCGAALEPRLENSQSIVCGQCQSVVDISRDALGAGLAHYAQQVGMQPQIPLGSTGLLALSGGKPLPWQVVGYLERCDIPESAEDEQSFWREYLLFNKTEGFAFLVDTDEGWSLVRPLTGAPRGKGERVEWQGKTFSKRWTYTAKVTHVLGEFYWRVKREERALVSDYECKTGSRSELLSREQSGQEVVWSHGRALDAAEVHKAFALAPELGAALQRDARSLSADSGTLLRNIVVGLFMVALVFALIRGCSRDDCEDYRDAYGASSQEYQQCQQRSSGSGVRFGSGGGSYGGYSGGGGGHK
ncbi:MAG: DUF4178 domain-containing protein [Roseateles sp.]